MEQIGNLGKQHDDSLFFPLFNPSCPESFALTIIDVNVINYFFTEHSRLVIGWYSILLFKMKSNNITLHSQLFCNTWDSFNKPGPHIIHHPEPLSQFFEPLLKFLLQAAENCPPYVLYVDTHTEGWTNYHKTISQRYIRSKIHWNEEWAAVICSLDLPSFIMHIPHFSILNCTWNCELHIWFSIPFYRLTEFI